MIDYDKTKFGTCTEYARHTGLALQTISNYIKLGRIVTVAVDVEAEAAPLLFGDPKPAKQRYLINFAASDAMLERAGRKVRLQKVETNGDGAGASERQVGDVGAGHAASTPASVANSLVDLEHRTRSAMARRKELEVGELEGSLVRVDHVRDAWAQVLSVVKSGVLRLPDKLAPAVVACEDYREARELIEGACMEVLRDVSSELAATAS